MQYRPEQRSILSGAGDGWVAEWSVDQPADGALLARIETQIFSLLFLEANNLVVLGNMQGGVHWVDLEQPKNTLNIAHHKGGVYGIERHDHLVWTLGGDGLLTRWDLENRTSIDSLRLSQESLRCLAYCPQRNEIAIGASDHAIYLLDADSLSIRSVIAGAHNNSVFCLTYSSNGELLFSGGRDAHLKRWVLGKKVELSHAVPAHWFTVNDLVWGPGQQYLISGSRDKTIKIWNPRNLELLKVLEPGRDGGHVNSVNRLLWVEDSQTLVSGSDDRSLIFWKISPD